MTARPSISPPCIFCRAPRTKKRGEHVWDNWLNRLDGSPRRDPSTTHYWGEDGRFIRSHPSRRIDVTFDVVCDRCNNTWMSELSNEAKRLLEGSILRDSRIEIDAVGAITIAAFAFLKSAVLDWSSLDGGRSPCIPRWACKSFCKGLSTAPSAGLVVIPAGVQVWVARYRRTHKMEALAFVEELSPVSGRFRGYRILLVTYVVGSFIFQFVYPTWRRLGHKVAPPPFFENVRDPLSIPVWPWRPVLDVSWPPPVPVDRSGLDRLRERFRRASAIE